MGKWKTIELSPSLCEIIAGSTPSTSDTRYWSGENVWITPNDLSNLNGYIINDSMKKLTDLGVKRATGKLLPANSVVISCRAPVGYCAVSSVPFSTNQGCKTLICNAINETFLYYFLSQSTDALERVSSGTTFLELPKKELARFKVFCPCEQKEQRKIAEILTTVDKSIDNTRALVEKYINIKTGMMQDLLLNSNWEYGFFSDLVEINPSTHKTIHFNIEVDFIPMQDINENGVWEIRETRLAKNCMKGFTIFIENDVLFAKITPCMENGKGCIVKGLRYGIGFGSTEFHVLRAKANTDPGFVYQWSIFSYLREKAIAFMVGSAGQQRVSADFFQKFRIKIPPKTEQQFISDQLIAVDEKIQAENDYLTKLLNIKKGLMQDLLTNTISVDPLL